MRTLVKVFTGLVGMSVLLSANAQGESGEFPPTLPGRVLEFPRDHGAHYDSRTEWWYFTGHLEGHDGRRFGFQLTFFRIGIAPELPSPSAWATRSLFMAHCALTDDEKGRFVVREEFRRGSFDEAGAADSTLKVWIKEWKAELDRERIQLRSVGGCGLDLELRPAKPLVLHGSGGYSEKGSERGEGSYYVSWTRLVGRGTITLLDERIEIERAEAWMDHEFTNAEYARATVGWDWFGIQLDSYEELMLFELRNTARGETKRSGTFVDRTGEAIPLESSDFQITPLATWTSAESGVTYPAKWRVTVRSRAMDLMVTPTVSNQELKTDATTGVTYWEGRSQVVGQVGSQSVRGNAYVELVGPRP